MSVVDFGGVRKFKVITVYLVLILLNNLCIKSKDDFNHGE